MLRPVFEIRSSQLLQRGPPIFSPGQWKIPGCAETPSASADSPRKVLIKEAFLR